VVTAKTNPTGIPIDASGGPTIDPTKNVLDLVTAAIGRQDDLREASEKLAVMQLTCQKEVGDLRERHAEVIRDLQARHLSELSKAEAARLDSIRQIDREEGGKTAAQISAAVQTLASQTQANAETLRNQVAQTAETLRNQVATTQLASQNTFNTTVAEFNKRISQLELSSSEGKGKQTLSDPMLLEMVAEMKATNRTLAVGGGKAESMSQFLGWIVGIAGAVVAAIVFIMKG
jgi:hypothetical protein